MNRTIRAMMLSLPLVLAAGGCGGPPQIGTNKEAFKTVDALYTAVSLRDSKLVAQCEERLEGLRDSGSLPADASKSLDSIIAEAKAGDWEALPETAERFHGGAAALSPWRAAYTGGPGCSRRSSASPPSPSASGRGPVCSAGFNLAQRASV